jgi:hypothetical protein
MAEAKLNERSEKNWTHVSRPALEGENKGRGDHQPKSMM